MTTRAWTGAISLVLILAACSATAGVTTTEAPSTTVSVPTAASIPAGTYVKADTRQQLVASGVDERLIDDVFGAAQEFRQSLKVDDTRWSHFFSVDGSADELGDLGTYTYDDQGRWMITSESEGAAGLVLALVWEYDGEALTLQVDWDHSSPVPEEQQESDSMVVNGVYERTG